MARLVRQMVPNICKKSNRKATETHPGCCYLFCCFSVAFGVHFEQQMARLVRLLAPIYAPKWAKWHRNLQLVLTHRTFLSDLHGEAVSGTYTPYILVRFT